MCGMKREKSMLYEEAWILAPKRTDVLIAALQTDSNNLAIVWITIRIGFLYPSARKTYARMVGAMAARLTTFS